MHKLAFIAAAALLAAPAAAQAPVPPPPAEDPLAEEMVRIIPPAHEIEAMAPALEHMMGALLSIDVGPIMDAADPLRRNPDYGRPGRTVGAMGRRDDPYFEQRMRSDIRRGTAMIGGMSQAMAAAAPAMAQSIRQMERAMEGAIDEYERRREAAPRRLDPDEYRRVD